jgi:hypothetical protein
LGDNQGPSLSKDTLLAMNGSGGGDRDSGQEAIYTSYAHSQEQREEVVAKHKIAANKVLEESIQELQVLQQEVHQLIDAFVSDVKNNYANYHSEILADLDTAVALSNDLCSTEQRFSKVADAVLMFHDCILTTIRRNHM